MEKLVKLSDYVFIFVKEKNMALYHSLGIMPIYTSVQNWRFCESLRQPHLAGKFRGNKLYKLLLEKQFIVPLKNDSMDFFQMCESVFFREVEIEIMYLILVDSCNFRCHYCLIENNKIPGYKAKMMTPDIFKTSWKRFFSWSAEKQEQERTVIFYGGEPLLNWNVLRGGLEYIYTEFSHQPSFSRFHFVIITNGSLVNEEIAEELARRNVSVAVSLDGLKRQNLHRISAAGGLDTFNLAIRGFKILKEKGLNPSISCTLTDENLEDGMALIDFLLSLAPKTIAFNIVYNSPKFRNSPGYFEKVSKFLLDAFIRLREEGIYEDRIMRKLRPFVMGKLFPFDCAAYGHQVVIAPDGEVGICHALLGSRQGYGRQIIDPNFNPKEEDEYKLWLTRSPLHQKMVACRKCPAISICGGGCAFSALQNNGDIFIPDKDYCYHAQKTLEWMIWDLGNRI